MKSSSLSITRCSINILFWEYMDEESSDCEDFKSLKDRNHNCFSSVLLLDSVWLRDTSDNSWEKTTLLDSSVTARKIPIKSMLSMCQTEMIRLIAIMYPSFIKDILLNICSWLIYKTASRRIEVYQTFCAVMPSEKLKRSLLLMSTILKTNKVVRYRVE